MQRLHLDRRPLENAIPGGTHLAARRQFGQLTELTSLDSIGEVFAAVEKRQIDLGVVPVENTVFGARVNVAGLVNGCDWRDALAGSDEDLVVLPRTTLDYFGERFLDGMSTGELSEALGKPVLYASQWSEIWAAVSGHAPGRMRQVATNGAMWSTGREERFDPHG